MLQTQRRQATTYTAQPSSPGYYTANGRRLPGDKVGSHVLRRMDGAGEAPQNALGRRKGALFWKGCVGAKWRHEHPTGNLPEQSPDDCCSAALR